MSSGFHLFLGLEKRDAEQVRATAAHQHLGEAARSCEPSFYAMIPRERLATPLRLPQAAWPRADDAHLGREPGPLRGSVSFGAAGSYGCGEPSERVGPRDREEDRPEERGA